jgi:hypothetical protein
MEVAETAPHSHRILHHPPEAFNRVEVMAAVGREEMERKRSSILCQRRGQFLGPMDAAAINHPNDLFVGFAKDRHDLMNIWAPCFCVKMRDDLREETRGAILDGPDDAEQHATGDAAPRAILEPRLAFEGFVAFDLTLTQGACAARGRGLTARCSLRSLDKVRLAAQQSADRSTQRRCGRRLAVHGSVRRWVPPFLAPTSGGAWSLRLPPGVSTPRPRAPVLGQDTLARQSLSDNVARRARVCGPLARSLLLARTEAAGSGRASYPTGADVPY